MDCIKPIANLTHEEIVAIAHNAADNGAPWHEANPFACGTPQHHIFNGAHQDRVCQLHCQPAASFQHEQLQKVASLFPKGGITQ